MDTFIMTIQPWHWLVFGFALLVIETLGAGGFLIGLAIAAMVQSVIAANFVDLSWDFQLAVFAVNAIVFTVLYWRFFRKFNQKTDAPQINDRAAQFIGRQFELKQALVNGEGKITIGDTLWRVRANENLQQGTQITVKATDGMTLLVEPT